MPVEVKSDSIENYSKDDIRVKYIKEIIKAVEAVIQPRANAVVKDENLSQNDKASILISALSNIWSSGFVGIIATGNQSNLPALKSGKELIDTSIEEARKEAHRRLDKIINSNTH